MKNILIIEDDMQLAESIGALLSSASYSFSILEDFNNSLNEVINGNYDLVLLDINIPYINGEVLLKDIRKKSMIPIIMLTSVNSEMSEALCISNGADDYITKPFNPTLLLLRIANIFRRTHSNILKYKDLNINIGRCSLYKDNIELILTKNEMLIFMELYNNIGNIVSRDQIMNVLWNNEEYVNDNALSVNISRLRSKLSDFGYPSCIETRKGLGYILK